MLLGLRQQVRYEQAETFDEVGEVIEKKEVSMEEVPRLTMQSMVKVIEFSIELKSRKHPEMSLNPKPMESTMEQMISNE